MLILSSGRFKGLKLQAPQGPQTRPSAARLRQAVMNVLRARFSMPPVARALDLFAGSGAMGFECLSSGFSEVHFVENHSQTLRVLKKNMQHFARNAQLHRDFPAWTAELDESDVFSFLDAMRTSEKGAPEAFDVIWADPPYHQGVFPRMLKIMAEAPERFLREQGLFFFEEDGDLDLFSGQENELLFKAGLRLLETKKYGGSQVLILVKGQSENPP